MFCLDQEATFDRKPDTGGEDVVRLFAVLRDCRRENDGADPGPRPARGRLRQESASPKTIRTSLVPPEYKVLHSTLVELRHKAFAHTDASGHLPGRGMMMEVRLVFEGGSVVNFSSRPILEPELLPHIKTLSDLLAQKVKEMHDTFYDQVLKAIVPRFGIADIGNEFELNVQDEKGPMVVASKDPMQHKYPFVRRLPRSS
jgi:hypothetical protein